MIKRSPGSSLYDERASTPAGAASLAAARVASMVVDIMTRAKRACGISSRALAERLEITEGRVSQVLSGDGNVHVATLARFLHAMGYDVEIRAVPIDGLGEPLGPTPGRRRRRADSNTQYVHVFQQQFVTGSGIWTHDIPVPTDEFGAAALGEPALTRVVEPSQIEGVEGISQSLRSAASWTTERRVTVAARIKDR